MSHIINKAGAKTDLLNNLRQRGIYRFSSINDLIVFKRNYLKDIDDFREKKSTEVKTEIEDMSKELCLLRSEYEQRYTEGTELVNIKITQLKTKLAALPTNIVSKIRGHFLRKQLLKLEENFDCIVNEPLQELRSNIYDKTIQFNHLTTCEREVILKRSASFIAETERIVAVLTELAPQIYGAIGELKAIELLRSLPNEYYVINNYQRSFHRPLHMKSEDDWIYSIQLDHVVVGPTGVFVIETKYWSSKSISNNNLFSPVKQLRRGGFALFVVINKEIREYQAFNKHWGTTQVAVSNILLMMNATTNEQFQFVKILTASNLINHIVNRPAILSDEQVRCLVEDVL